MIYNSVVSSFVHIRIVHIYTGYLSKHSTARIEVYVCVLALCIDGCINCSVGILGGHAGLVVVMPSLTSQFCMGVT
jgi:hypothetical protein